MAILNSYFIDSVGVNHVTPEMGTVFVDESTIPVGLSAPRIVEQSYPGQDGTFWDGAITYEPLEFPIIFTVVPVDLEARQILMDGLHYQFTQRTKLLELQYQPVPTTSNPTSTRRTIDVYRSSSVSIKRLNRKDFQYSFMMTAPKPFWRGSTTLTSTIPTLQDWVGGVSSAPIMDASIDLYGPFTTATITCVANGQSFVVSTSCASGERIRVQPYKWVVQKQTAAGAYISNQVTKLVPAKGLGGIMDVEAGNWKAAFTGSGSGTKAQMVYREWFL
jgi:hypothetical protein